MRCITLLVLTLITTASFALADEQIVQHIAANGKRNLRPFTVQDNWEIRWEAKDRISIWIYKSNGDPLEEAASQRGAGTGTSFQPKGGTYYLSILAGGDWDITVVQLPQGK